MGAVYFNNTFLQEEAAAACQEIYRVMLLSAPEKAAQMLFCPMFCLTLPALTNPGSEGQADTRQAQQ